MPETLRQFGPKLRGPTTRHWLSTKGMSLSEYFVKPMAGDLHRPTKLDEEILKTIVSKIIFRKVLHKSEVRHYHGGINGKNRLMSRKEWCPRLKCLLIGVAAWSLVAGAWSEVLASQNVQQDFFLWSPVFLTVPLSTSFLGYADVNPRFGDDVSELNQLVLRTAVGYKLDDRWSIWQGYAWSAVYYDANNQPDFTGENRIYQQLLYNDKFPFLERFPFIKINSRSRLEERWIAHTSDTALRARTMLRVDVPLPMIPSWGFVTFDEVFVNLNGVSGGPEGGFDQNRFFIGFNREFLKQFNVDLGYQMQVINLRGEGIVNQINNCIMINFFINL